MQALIDEVSKPEYDGLNGQPLADAVNAATDTIIVSTPVTELGILAAFPPDEAERVLQSIEAVAQQNPVVARASRWMAPGAPGLDFANPAVRGAIDGMVGVAITREQATTLKALAERLQPRWQTIGLSQPVGIGWLNAIGRG